MITWLTQGLEHKARIFVAVIVFIWMIFLSYLSAYQYYRMANRVDQMFLELRKNQEFSQGVMLELRKNQEFGRAAMLEGSARFAAILERLNQQVQKNTEATRATTEAVEQVTKPNP